MGEGPKKINLAHIYGILGSVSGTDSTASGELPTETMSSSGQTITTAFIAILVHQGAVTTAFLGCFVIIRAGTASLAIVAGAWRATASLTILVGGSGRTTATLATSTAAFLGGRSFLVIRTGRSTGTATLAIL